MSTTLNLNGATTIVQDPLEQTSVLHRTSWVPPVAASAEGIYITLKDGRTLIDAAGGAAVTCIGNGHPKVIKAIQDQTAQLAYVYSMQLSSDPTEALAKDLIASSNGAFELVAFYFLEVGQPTRTKYIARNLSYHGNTLGTLGVASHPTRKAQYQALLPSDAQGTFHHVSPAFHGRFAQPGESEGQYVERLKAELDAKFQEIGSDSVIGFVAETVVGATTGAVAAPKGYFKAVCDKYGALLILDEVMCGMGRMGTLHAWESFGDGISPDLQASAKGSGSGFMNHGHTYQSHPIATAGALAVQHVLRDEDLLAQCRARGALLSQQLRDRLLGTPYVFDVRGGGLFWAVDFELDAAATARMRAKHGPKAQFAALLYAKCFENGLVTMAFSGGGSLAGDKGDFLLLAPAYNITPEQVGDIVDRVVKSVEELVAEI
ncbi:PLP-dependent transferase [Auriculariales sp. MPI-PUGE-AT-0066]|nr:PLP-dependent transferase [Auriculariales sp. MPI-PUGE-AT-0066]